MPMPQLAVQTGEFTFQHYASWPEGERWELLDGRAHAMAAPNWAHQSVVFELARQLGNALLGQRCQARVAPVGVRLPRSDEADDVIDTVFEPDLLIVCDPTKIDTKGVRGAPDVVIEVLSPRTAGFDQVEKRARYEQAGVRELWFVDVLAGVITILQRTGSAFGPSTYVRAEGAVPIEAIPDLTLDLEFMRAFRAQDDE